VFICRLNVNGSCNKDTMDGITGECGGDVISCAVGKFNTSGCVDALGCTPP